MGMSAEGESDQCAVGSLLIMSQGATVGDSKEGLGMRLVQEHGGAVDAEEEQVEMVVVVTLVTVIVDGGATLGQVVGGLVVCGGQLVGDSEMVTGVHDVEGGVVGVFVAIH